LDWLAKFMALDLPDLNRHRGAADPRIDLLVTEYLAVRFPLPVKAAPEVPAVKRPEPAPEFDDSLAERCRAAVRKVKEENR
jgi:hypothetical protein